MTTRHPPLTPSVLYVDDKDSPWRAPAIFRLPTHYHTETTVRCTVVPNLPLAANQSFVSKPQTQVYPLRDNVAWDRVTAAHAALQQALDDLANGLRALGSYAARLEEAGGWAVAPNPLCPAVASCADPDRRESTSWFWSDPVPRMERYAVTRHTPKMLAGTRTIAMNAIETTWNQRDQFVLPDEAAWERLQELHQAALARAAAWTRLLNDDLLSYDRAVSDGRYAALAETALAQVPAAPMVIGAVMMRMDEARACITRIQANLESIRADLLALHDQEGWRALGYESWRACVAAEFGQSQSYLYRQLAAAEIERDLGLPIGATPESHLRPLGALDSPMAKQQALARADVLAGDAPRQARHVQQAVAETRAEPTSMADVTRATLPPELAARARPEPPLVFTDDHQRETAIVMWLGEAARVPIGSAERKAICDRAFDLARAIVDGDTFRRLVQQINALQFAAPSTPPAPTPPADNDRGLTIADALFQAIAGLDAAIDDGDIDVSAALHAARQVVALLELADNYPGTHERISYLYFMLAAYEARRPLDAETRAACAELEADLQQLGGVLDYVAYGDLEARLAALREE